MSFDDLSRCHSKKPLKVGFRRWSAVNPGVVVDEREILPLLDCERRDLLRRHCAGTVFVGASYWSSLERERRTASVQFSSVSPFTRPNSAVLFVTSLSPRLRT